MRRKILILFVAIVAISATFGLSGCQYTNDNSDNWKTKFDITLPNFEVVGDSIDNANNDGWYSTLIEEFDRETLGEMWNPVPHYKRDIEYWCDDMVSIKGGKVEVVGLQSKDYKCSKGLCPTDGYFTSGIETRVEIDGQRKTTFEQAYGYFEAKVKFPYSSGMWSAFWLQTETTAKLGNKGMDGSEIDIYESFYWTNKSDVGHCIHYDGYGKEHRGGKTMRDTGKNLYEGYHTFALKWTPSEYVFYVDGVATWATDFGGICRVPAFIKLTNEIRPNKNKNLGDFGVVEHSKSIMSKFIRTQTF